jgi:copper chaperone NosL
MDNTLSKLSKAILIIATVLLITSIFLPLWVISLDAPQYPEGLEMKIYADRIGGDIDIINGLNHYIGMQTLHAENFFEFTILRYLIGFYALLCLIAMFMNKKRALYFVLWAFIIFGCVAMIDFWRWEYNYGHNLDPKAAIIVPGMSYQPPLIGYKKLLNFGAFAMPDIGGWTLFSAGVLLLFASLKESNLLKKKKINSSLVVSLSLVLLMACSTPSVSPIKINSDRCGFCEMTISNGKFAAELITQKGRVYKFDDLHCMLGYQKENSSTVFEEYYINDYSLDNVLIPAKSAFYVHNDDLHSPMRGNTAAFGVLDSAKSYATRCNKTVATWAEIEL